MRQVIAKGVIAVIATTTASPAPAGKAGGAEPHSSTGSLDEAWAGSPEARSAGRVATERGVA
jgi:hypothetical protein